MFVRSSSSMIPSLFVLVNLAHFVYAIQTNSTMTGLPHASGSGTPRTIWGILGSCAVTILICIWHALHFDIGWSWGHIFLNVGLVPVAIIMPEVIVADAVRDWWHALLIVKRFRDQGYQWSMTHCLFAEMGGFVYRDENGDLRTIKSLEFLQLCKENKILNPLITVKEIKDKSKSDALAKTIFAVQLLWFVVQVVARACSGFAITLLEIDTVAMAALSLMVFWFWWDKPHCPTCPHVFYSPHDVRPDPMTADLIMKKAWGPVSRHLSMQLLDWFGRKTLPATAEDEKDEIALINGQEEPTYLINDPWSMQLDWFKRKPLFDTVIARRGQEEPARPIKDTSLANELIVRFCSLCVTWLILGGLHLLAWNFHFPTEVEKIRWRVASLLLTGSPIACLPLYLAHLLLSDERFRFLAIVLMSIPATLGVVARVILIVLMLGGLRALPPSAYETVAWTAFIPHL